VRSRHDWIIWTGFGAGLVLTLGLVVVPVLSGIWLSFQSAESFIATPHWVGFGNYARLLRDPGFWRATLNGAVYALASVALQLVLGVGFAVVLNKRFRFRGVVRGLSILPYLLPTVVVGVTFQWMTDGSFGVITALTRALGLGVIPWFESPFAAMSSVVLISVWLWTPFVTVSCLAAMQAIPLTLYEAAKVDGASSWNRFWHITLPQLMHVLGVVALLRTIWMFNKFDVIWLLTKGGPLGATETLPVLAYNKAFNLFDVGGGAAVATLGFLVLSGFLALYFRLTSQERKRLAA
jgi:multiple sugar transport system permease protein